MVDRPTQGHRFLSREYVQPQWVFDSANFRVLARPPLYAPGKAPPPHLSPFVSADEEGYVPEYGRQLAALQEAARAARKRRAAAARGGDVFVGEEEEGGAGAGPLTAEEEAEAAEARYAAELAKELKVGGCRGGVGQGVARAGWWGTAARCREGEGGGLCACSAGRGSRGSRQSKMHAHMALIGVAAGMAAWPPADVCSPPPAPL